jgi:hypothetical protein
VRRLYRVFTPTAVQSLIEAGWRTGTAVIYWLSAGDEVTTTSADWDDFALQNGGSEATAHAVLGRPLWQFVQGLATRRFLSQLFLDCRLGRGPVTLPYRCDGLGEDRLFALCITPEGRGALRLEHRLLRRRRAFAGTLPKAVVTAEFRQCSICLSCHTGSHWMAPGRLIRTADTRVTYVVCPACQGGLRSPAPGMPEDTIPC